MTIEELKAEADKLGYSVVKKQQYVKLSPCICGQKKPREWFRIGSGNVVYQCPNCDFAAPEAKTRKQARLNWNKSVEVT